MAGTKIFPDCLSVITTVAQYAIRTMPWASPLSLQVWDGVNEFEGLLRIASTGTGQLGHEGNSVSITNQVTLAAQLCSISRIRSRLRPPKTARIEQPSTTVLDQSILE